MRYQTPDEAHLRRIADHEARIAILERLFQDTGSMDAYNDTRYVNVGGDTMTGPLLLPNGSLANPAAAFSGDPNTGLYHTANADEQALVSGGVAKLIIPGSGSLTSPVGLTASGNVVASASTVQGRKVIATTDGGGASDVGVEVQQSTHSTSTRASAQFDDWLIGQSAAADATKDFFLYQISAALVRIGVDVNGRMRLPAHPHFELRHNAVVSVTASTFTGIPWSGETNDPAAMHAGTDTFVTVPVGGLWLFHCTFPTDASTTAGARSIAFYRNNDTSSDSTDKRYAGAQVDKAVATQFSLAISAVIRCDAGDTIRPMIWHNVGGGPHNWGVASRRDLQVFGGCLVMGL